MSVLKFIELAFTVGLSSTFGYGEYNCGNIGHPKPCIKGQPTASGIPLDPDAPQAAVAAPTNLRMYPVTVYMRVSGGPCVAIEIVDKMNPRYIGRRGFDLTKGALRALGLPDHPQLVRVESCKPEDTE